MRTWDDDGTTRRSKTSWGAIVLCAVLLIAATLLLIWVL
jgi:hypothetical protein